MPRKALPVDQGDAAPDFRIIDTETIDQRLDVLDGRIVRLPGRGHQRATTGQ
jgi:hypothetical protein